jgi:hypothetical protein
VYPHAAGADGHTKAIGRPAEIFQCMVSAP